MPTEEIIEVSVDINDVMYSFIVDPVTGEVFDSKYNVICTTGG
jgi:hypothetical protein